MMRNIIFFTILFVCNVLVSSYRILGLFPHCGYSHFTLGFRLMKELADRGHEVTFVNCFPQKEPIKNFKDISVEEIKPKLADFFNLTTLCKIGEMTYFDKLGVANKFNKRLTRALLENENIHILKNSDEKFDLVIAESFFAEFLVLFARKFNCPLILFAPGAASVYNNDLFKNPAPTAYVTDIWLPFSSRMNFWQRLYNSFCTYAAEINYHINNLPDQQVMLNQVFPDAPDIKPILYNASLLLVASDVSIGGSLPNQPNVKLIGGFHVLPPKPLPKDIKDYLDNATEGVVIFAMGTLIKSSEFDSDKKKIVLEAFSKIKEKVLWKFEEDLAEKPDNVRIVNWYPQSDVLGHPNVRAFISHGGLLGTTEAVYHGVPILGLPVFWDQWRNLGLAEGEGYAIHVNYIDITKESFEWGLNEILNNPKYRAAAKRRSAIMHDQPIKKIDEAVFWCEYVIRHKGAPHLRSPALNLKWYQLYLLDIILFIVILISVALITANLFLRYFLSFFLKSKRIIKKDKKN